MIEILWMRIQNIPQNLKSKTKALWGIWDAMNVKKNFELLNDAFTATPSDGDAQPLCSDSHPSNADASYAGDNLIPGALNDAAISNARLQMRKLSKKNQKRREKWG